MKMNKIIIPVAALAMGVALVGSVSSTLAWYQYSTKAQAAFIGASVGEAENLEIKADATHWKTNVTASEVNSLAGLTSRKDFLPITSGAMGKNDSIDTTAFHGGIETGVAGYNDVHVDPSTNFVQFTLNMRYKKTGSAATSYEKRELKLIDLTIVDENTNPGNDFYKSIRVHFSTGEGATKNFLYASNKDDDADIETVTRAQLDTDNDGKLDKALEYEFADGYTNLQPVYYGDAASQNGTPKQVALNAYRENANSLNQVIGVLPDGDNAADGLAVTVTIWIEGWQKLASYPEGNKDGGPFWRQVTLDAFGTDSPWVHDFGETAVENGKLYFDKTSNELFSCNDAEHANEENSWSLVTSTNGTADPTAAAAVDAYYAKVTENDVTLFQYQTGESSAMWKPETYSGSIFNVGMRFQAGNVVD